MGGVFWAQKAVQRGLQLRVPLGQCEVQADSRVTENCREHSHVNIPRSCFPSVLRGAISGEGLPSLGRGSRPHPPASPQLTRSGRSLSCAITTPTRTMLGNLPTRSMTIDSKLETKMPKQTNQPNATPLHPQQEGGRLLHCPTQRVPSRGICSRRRHSASPRRRLPLEGSQHLGASQEPQLLFLFTLSLSAHCVWGSRLWSNSLEIEADFPDTHGAQRKAGQAHRKELRSRDGLKPQVASALPALDNSPNAPSSTFERGMTVHSPGWFARQPVRHTVGVGHTVGARGVAVRMPAGVCYHIMARTVHPKSVIHTERESSPAHVRGTDSGRGPLFFVCLRFSKATIFV